MTTPSQQRARSEEILEQLRDARQDTQYARQKEHRISHWLRPFALRQAELEAKLASVERDRNILREERDDAACRIAELIGQVNAAGLRQPDLPESLRERLTPSEIYGLIKLLEPITSCAQQVHFPNEAILAASLFLSELRTPPAAEVRCAHCHSTTHTTGGHSFGFDPPSPPQTACEHEWVGPATGATHCSKCNTAAPAVEASDDTMMQEIGREMGEAAIGSNWKRRALAAETELFALRTAGKPQPPGLTDREEIEQLKKALIQGMTVLAMQHVGLPSPLLELDPTKWKGPLGEIARELAK